MNDTKHTPGPWRLTFGTADATIHSGETIAAVTDEVIQWQANALLIAAAPELLAALEPFAAWLDNPSVPILAAIRPDEWDAVRATIAKVKGGAG